MSWPDEKAIREALDAELENAGLFRRDREPIIERFLARVSPPRGDEGEAHDTYPAPVDGGWGGYQAACHDCEWRGPHRDLKDTAREDCKDHPPVAPRGDGSQVVRGRTGVRGGEKKDG